MTPHELRVRVRRDRDLRACGRIVRLVEFEGYDLGRAGQRPRSWLDAAEVAGAWVATGGGHVLGHAALVLSPGDRRAAERWQELTGHEPSELGFVSRFFVRPRNRRQGVETVLLERVTGEIHASGRVPVLETPDPHPGTEEFLFSAGWRLRAVDAASTWRGGRVSRYAFPTAVGAEQARGRLVGAPAPRPSGERP